MFRSQNQMLKLKTPKDGLKVIVRGYVSIYEQGGSFISFILSTWNLQGMGNLYLDFEQLNRALVIRHIQPRQKKIPYLPRSIAKLLHPRQGLLSGI